MNMCVTQKRSSYPYSQDTSVLVFAFFT